MFNGPCTHGSELTIKKPTQQYVAIASRTGGVDDLTVHVFETQGIFVDSSPVWTYAHTSDMLDVAMDQHTGRVASISDDDKVFCFDIEGTKLWEKTPTGVGGNGLRECAFDVKNAHTLWVTGDGAIWQFDGDGNETKHTLPGVYVGSIYPMLARDTGTGDLYSLLLTAQTDSPNGRVVWIDARDFSEVAECGVIPNPNSTDATGDYGKSGIIPFGGSAFVLADDHVYYGVMGGSATKVLDWAPSGYPSPYGPARGVSTGGLTRYSVCGGARTGTGPFGSPSRFTEWQLRVSSPPYILQGYADTNAGQAWGITNVGTPGSGIEGLWVCVCNLGSGAGVSNMTIVGVDDSGFGDPEWEVEYDYDLQAIDSYRGQFSPGYFPTYEP